MRGKHHGARFVGLMLLFLLPVFFLPGESQAEVSPLEVLAGQLKESKDWSGKLRVLRKIGRLGIHAKPLREKVAALLGDKSKLLRATAAWVLGELGDPEAADALLAATRDRKKLVRAAATEALRKLDVRSEKVVRALGRMLRDRDRWTRVAAALALGRMGAKATPALRDFKRALRRHQDWFTARNFAATAARLGPHARPLSRDLASLLRNRDRRTRLLTIQALATFGKPTKSAADALRIVLSDKHKSVATAARKLLRTHKLSLKATAPSIGLTTPGGRNPFLGPFVYMMGMSKIPASVPTDPLSPEETTQLQGWLAQLNTANNDAAVKGIAALGLRALPALSAYLTSNANRRNTRGRIAACKLIARLGYDARFAMRALTQLIRGREDGVGEEATRTIAAIGPYATPFVLKMATSNNWRLRRRGLVGVKALGAWAVPGLIKMLNNRSWSVRSRASNALIALGRLSVPVLAYKLRSTNFKTLKQSLEALRRLEGAAAPAARSVQALMLSKHLKLRWYKYSQIRTDAARVLGNAGAAGVPGLLVALQHPNSRIRSAAGNGLRTLGWHHPQELIKLAKHEDDRIRAAVINALGYKAKKNKKLLAIAIAGLSDSNESVQATAIRSIPNLGLKGKQVEDALAKALQSDSRELRQAALRGLRKGQLNPKRFVPLLLQMLQKNTNTRMQRGLLRALQGYKGKAAVALPTLTKMAQDPNLRPFTRYRLMQTFGAIGPKAVSALPMLRGMLKSPKGQERRSAAEAIAGLGKAGAPAFPEVLAAFQSALQGKSSWRSRMELRAYAKVFKAVGPVAAPAVGGIQEALTKYQKSTYFAKALVEALGAIGPKAASAVPNLCKMLPKASWSTANTIAETIAGAGKTGIQCLEKLLDSTKKTSVRRSIYKALAKAGPASAALAPKLVAHLLVETSVFTRRFQGKALVGIGAKSVPHVLPLLDKKHKSKVRRMAANILGRLGPKAKEARSALIEGAFRPGASSFDRSAYYDAALAVTQGTPEQQQLLDRGARDRSFFLRRAAQKVYIKQGKAALPALLAMVQGKDGKLQRFAITVLNKLGVHTPTVIKALEAALNHNDAKARSYAAMALGKAGKKATSALPALRKACNDSYWSVRAASLRALHRIQPGAPAHLPIFLERIKDPKSPSNRKVSAYALRAYPTQVSKLLAPLGRALMDKDRMVRFNAIGTIGSIGPGAAKLTNLLISRLEDPYARNRKLARKALRSIGSRAVSSLVFGLTKGKAQILRSLYALSLLGKEAATARASIASMLQSNDPQIQAAALKTLRAIGLDASIKTQLTTLLQAKDAALRAVAAQLLGSLGKGGKSAIPALRKASRDKAWQVRAAAVEALGSLGDKASQASIQKRMMNDEFPVRIAAWFALQSLQSTQ